MVAEVSVYRPTYESNPAAAHGQPGAASATVEQRRRGDYDSLPAGTHWRPFVVDTYGHVNLINSA